MSSPAIRARSAQEALVYAESWKPDMIGRVRALVPADSMALIDGLSTNAWLSVEHDRRLPRAIVAVYGRDDAFDLWRSFIPSHVESPLLGTMFNAAVRMFGVNPGIVAWLVPKGFGNVYRDFATPRLIERGDGIARFALDDIHPQVWAVSEYLLCLHAIVQGLVDATSRGRPVELSVELSERDRSMTFDIRW